MGTLSPKPPCSKALIDGAMPIIAAIDLMVASAKESVEKAPKRGAEAVAIILPTVKEVASIV